MKNAGTAYPSLADVQHVERYGFFATALTILVITASVLWMLFHIGGDRGTILFADTMYAVSAFLGAMWAFQGAYWMRRGPVLLTKAHRLGWILVGWGMIASGVGGLYYGYLEYLGQSPFPSYADIGFNLFYPLVGIGLLLMPTRLRFHTRLVMDALVTTLCLLGVSWYFLIGPLYKAQVGQVAPLALITALSYPVWDILLVLAVILVILRRSDPPLRFSLILFGLAVLADVWADSLYAYFNVFGNYQSGTFYIDPFWFVGFLLMGLAALYQYQTLLRRAYQEQALHLRMPSSPPDRKLLRYRQLLIRNRWSLVQNLLIYVPLLFLFSLTLYAESTKDNLISRWLVLLTVIVSILMAMRYLLATRENSLLLWERAQQHRMSEHLRHIEAKMAELLELNPLSERVVTTTVSELGFEAALLLLIETSHRVPLMQAKLLACMAFAEHAGREPAVTLWQGLDSATLRQVIGEGKIIEVQPTALIEMMPQLGGLKGVPALSKVLFLPLVYQGKPLGTLGVACREKQEMDEQDLEVLKSYTEIVATMVEHVHLYQERLEHALFARALANMAARLNTAIVEPAEIHSAICAEAAHALRASYALLYVALQDGSLMPRAVYSETNEVPNAVHLWPTLQAHELEARALYAVEPVMMELQPLNKRDIMPLPAITRPLPTAKTITAPLLSAGVRGQHRFFTLSLHERLEYLGAHSLVLAPLITKGRPVALLVLARTLTQESAEKRDFDRADLSHIQDFAEQAVVALTNAQLYQELRTAHQQLQELDSLKDQFMITASHELRTPLTSVQGYLELLAQYDEMLPPEDRRDFLQKARWGCDELVVMLNNIMDTSRLEVDAGIKAALMEPLEVRQVLESVIDLIKPHLAHSQREVHFNVPGQLYVLADPLRLRQVLLNISTNALKYSPPGSPLLYAAQRSFYRVPCVTISISDRGAGIPPHEQEKLFQRFVRLERDINSPVRGSGLGLYISRRLIEAMNGRIWVESRGIPGEGSTFYIQLPMASAPLTS